MTKRATKGAVPLGDAVRQHSVFDGDDQNLRHSYAWCVGLRRVMSLSSGTDFEAPRLSGQ